MPYGTPAGATPQPSLHGFISARSLRRRLTALALGVSFAAALVAPSVSIAAAAHTGVAPQSPGHTLLIAAGPTMWGCGGAPVDC